MEAIVQAECCELRVKRGARVVTRFELSDSKESFFLKIFVIDIVILEKQEKDIFSSHNSLHACRHSTTFTHAHCHYVVHAVLRPPDTHRHIRYTNQLMHIRTVDMFYLHNRYHTTLKSFQNLLPLLCATNGRHVECRCRE